MVVVFVSLYTCMLTSLPPYRLILPLAVFLLSVLHLGQFPARLGGWAVPSGSADPTACAPWPSPGEAPGRSSMQAACKCCLVYESCLLVQTAVWGELGKFVWRKALKLTKDCRAWAVINKTQGIWKRRSESFLSSPCSLNIPAVTDGCCSAWTR